MKFLAFIDENFGNILNNRELCVNPTVILTTVKYINRYDNGATAYVTGNDIGGTIWSDVLYCRFVL